MAGRSYPSDQAVCANDLIDEHLFSNFPMQYRRRFSALEGSEGRAALHHHRTADTGGLPERAPTFLAFRWREPYAHSPRAKYSSATNQCAFQCPLGKAFSL